MIGNIFEKVKEPKPSIQWHLVGACEVVNTTLNLKCKGLPSSFLPPDGFTPPGSGELLCTPLHLSKDVGKNLTFLDLFHLYFNHVLLKLYLLYNASYQKIERNEVQVWFTFYVVYFK